MTGSEYSYEASEHGQPLLPSRIPHWFLEVSAVHWPCSAPHAAPSTLAMKTTGTDICTGPKGCSSASIIPWI